MSQQVKDFVRRLSFRKAKKSESGKNSKSTTSPNTAASFAESQQATTADTVLRQTAPPHPPPPPPSQAAPPPPTAPLATQSVSSQSSTRQSAPKQSGASQRSLNNHDTTDAPQDVGSAGSQWIVQNLTLERHGKGLGFTISGGADSSYAEDTGDQNIYITKILDGGVAAGDGRLRVNDIILSVNNKSYVGLHHRDAVEILKVSGDTVKLSIKRAKRMAENFLEIDLVKGDRGLGFNVAGGVGSRFTDGDDGFFITKITPGTPAHTDGRMEIGDRLLAVNGKNLSQATHEEAIALLKSSKGTVRIAIAKGHSDTGDVFLPPERPVLQSTTIQNGAILRPPAAVSSTTATADLPKLVPRMLTDKDIPSFVKEPRVIVLKKKASAGLGFNIVGGKDGHGVFISSMIPGGVAEKNGELRRGDQLLLVNGINLREATHEFAVETLKAVVDTAKITVVQRPEEFTLLEKKLREYDERMKRGAVDKETQRKTTFIRALFDFDPSKETGLPSKGLTFSFGNILHVINTEDEDWWLARRVLPWSEMDSIGLIPSKKRVERRDTSKKKFTSMLSKNDNDAKDLPSGDRRRRSFILSKRLPFSKPKDKETNDENPAAAAAGEVAEAGAEISLSYQAVVQLQTKCTRPVIILGALRDRIHDDLTSEYPDKFAGCVPHTTRPMRRDEVDGYDYHFVASREQMERDIQNQEFIEAGQYNDQLYGMSLKAIKKVANQKKHCILDVTANAIVRLQAADVYPIAILIKPTSPAVISQWNKPITDEAARKAYAAVMKTLRDHAHTLTAVVTGDSPLEIYAKVKQVIQDQSQSIIWVATKDRPQILQ